jgi:hypothetical protein
LSAEKKFDILTLGPSWTDWTAIHARRFDADEESAIETSISGQHRLIEPIVIFHQSSFTPVVCRPSLEDVRSDYSPHPDLND